jgi:hypothetical protein
VERLERHSAGESAVSYDRHDLAVVAVAAAHGLLEAHRVGDRCGRVARAHDVVLGLEHRAERREASVLADGRELVAAAGEDLVGIGLVAHVPEDLVARRVEQRVQCHGDLAGAEIGAEVPADLADRFDDQLAHFLCDLLQPLLVEAVQVLRGVDLVEKAHEGRVRM